MNVHDTKNPAELQALSSYVDQLNRDIERLSSAQASAGRCLSFVVFKTNEDVIPKSLVHEAYERGRLALINEKKAELKAIFEAPSNWIET